MFINTIEKLIEISMFINTKVKLIETTKNSSLYFIRINLNDCQIL